MNGIHHDLECRIDDRAGVFRIEALDQGGRTLEIGEERGDGLAFAVVHAAGVHRRLLGTDAVREVGRCVTRRRRRADCVSVSTGRNRSGRTPDQHLAVLIERHALGIDQFGLDVLDIVVLQFQTPLQGAIRHSTFLLQDCADLGQQFDERHGTAFIVSFRSSVSRLRPWPCFQAGDPAA